MWSKMHSRVALKQEFWSLRLAKFPNEPAVG